jgi:hypothetical protein
MNGLLLQDNDGLLLSIQGMVCCYKDYEWFAVTKTTNDVLYPQNACFAVSKTMNGLLVSRT